MAFTPDPKHEKARQEFLKHARPGATFKHKSYPGSHFQVMGTGEGVPVGTLLEMNTSRAMGLASDMARYIETGQVEFTHVPPDLSEEVLAQAQAAHQAVAGMSGDEIRANLAKSAAVDVSNPQTIEQLIPPDPTAGQKDPNPMDPGRISAKESFHNATGRWPTLEELEGWTATPKDVDQSGVDTKKVSGDLTGGSDLGGSDLHGTSVGEDASWEAAPAGPSAPGQPQSPSPGPSPSATPSPAPNPQSQDPYDRDAQEEAAWNEDQQRASGFAAPQDQAGAAPEEVAPTPVPGHDNAGAHAFYGLASAIGYGVGSAVGGPFGGAVGQTFGMLADKGMSGKLTGKDVAGAALGLAGGMLAGGTGGKIGSILGRGLGGLADEGATAGGEGGSVTVSGGGASGGGALADTEEMVRLLREISTNIKLLTNDGIIIRGDRSRRGGGTI